MPASRTHEQVVYNTLDDEDDMPPLVDNPNPQTMTFTFAANMTPMAYRTPPPSIDMMPDTLFDDVALASPPDSPLLSPGRPSHSRRRDASYIPRPPNAFILFRSSFVKAQRVPGKIEGNHSTLSKIVGMYWKNLAPEEREVWERKALAAQAEHRRKYPDWRFRPANGLAKVKDGPVDARRRNRGQGRGESEEEQRSREKRCAKIVDLLGEGKAGPELAAAVEEYDRSRDVAQQRKSREASPVPDQEVKRDDVQVVKVEKEGSGQEVDTLTFKVPFAALSKRSSSAPAAPGRLPMLGIASLEPTKGLLAPLDSPFTAYIRPTGKGGLGEDRDSDRPRACNVATTMPIGSLNPPLPLAQMTSPEESSSANTHKYTPPHTPSGGDQELTYDGLVLGGLAFTHREGGYTFSNQVHDNFNPCATDTATNIDIGTQEDDRKHTPTNEALPFLSSYSSLRGWAGGVHSSKYSPHSPLPRLPHTSDTTSIMSAAFEAAAAFVPSTSAEPMSAHAPSPTTPMSPLDEQYLHEYSRGKRLMNILDLEANDSAHSELSYADVYGLDYA